MATVHTDNLEEGMVLSEEVKDIKGRLLLKKGQEIDSKHIKILKMWGVTEVPVVGEVENIRILSSESGSTSLKALL